MRPGPSSDFLAFLADHRHDAPASDEDARRAHELYLQHLRAARDEHGLNFLQPGRFLDPGPLGENSYMWFAPLDIPDNLERIADGTLAALMERRFEAYKTEVVTPFYSQHFRNYSRQVVLVDVLGALLAGQEVFEDTRNAIDAIMESFRYGRSGIISRLLQSARIEKVLFAATKADHVPEVQRDHLAALLRNMVAIPALDVSSSNAMFDVAALASVISTEEDTQEIDGHQVHLSRRTRAAGAGESVPPHSGIRASGHRRVADRRDPTHQSRPRARFSHRRSIAVTNRDSRIRPDEALRPRVLVVETPEKPHPGIEPSA